MKLQPAAGFIGRLNFCRISFSPVHFLCFFFFKAEKSNIRLDDVPPLASIDTILKTQESVQDVIVKEESIGQAKAEEQLSNEQADTYQRQMGDKFCAMVVRTTLLESVSMQYNNDNNNNE